MSMTFDYACTDCGRTGPVHGLSCDWEGTDLQRFEKAYIDILSIVTLPQFEGIRYTDLIDEVDQMADRGWTRLHAKCYKRLKRCGRLEVDSDGCVHHVRPEDVNSSWLSPESPRSHIEEALHTIDPDVANPVWFEIMASVRSWDDGQEGKDVFETWSRKGEKWDQQAKDRIEEEWSRDPKGWTLSTLAHHARKHGWSP